MASNEAPESIYLPSALLARRDAIAVDESGEVRGCRDGVVEL